MAAWSTEEVHTLVGVWGAADVQRQLDGVTRNKKIYQEIATSHNAYGYDRTWEQCRVKVKNLIQKYKQVKDRNGVTGETRRTCPFYNELDAILGNRAATRPSVVVDSGNGSETIPVLEDEGNTSPPPNPDWPPSFTPQLPQNADLSPSTSISSLSASSHFSPSATASQCSTPLRSLPSTPTDQAAPSCDNPRSEDHNSLSDTSASSNATRSKKRAEETSRKIGTKCVRDDGIHQLAEIFQRMDELSAQREERMRKMEIEMEMKMQEMEAKREERMLMLFAGLMNQRSGFGSVPMFNEQ
ncbi:hypothetical protein EMCRGX_G007556 [Ephydatia muelleri]